MGKGQSKTCVLGCFLEKADWNGWMERQQEVVSKRRSTSMKKFYVGLDPRDQQTNSYVWYQWMGWERWGQAWRWLCHDANLPQLSTLYDRPVLYRTIVTAPVLLMMQYSCEVNWCAWKCFQALSTFRAHHHSNEHLIQCSDHYNRVPLTCLSLEPTTIRVSIWFSVLIIITGFHWHAYL